MKGWRKFLAFFVAILALYGACFFKFPDSVFEWIVYAFAAFVAGNSVSNLDLGRKK